MSTPEPSAAQIAAAQAKADEVAARKALEAPKQPSGKQPRPTRSGKKAAATQGTPRKDTEDSSNQQGESDNTQQLSRFQDFMDLTDDELRLMIDQRAKARLPAHLQQTDTENPDDVMSDDEDDNQVSIIHQDVPAFHLLSLSQGWVASAWHLPSGRRPVQSVEGSAPYTRPYTPCHSNGFFLRTPPLLPVRRSVADHLPSQIIDETLTRPSISAPANSFLATLLQESSNKSVASRFRPGSQPGFNSAPFPAKSITDKVRAGIFVHLWHFTKAGIQSSYNQKRDSQAQRMAAFFGDNDVASVAGLKTDRDLNFSLFHQAQSTFLMVLDSQATSILAQTEAKAWQKHFADVLNHPSVGDDGPLGWSTLALYSELKRHMYYASSPSERCGDPAVWWNHTYEEALNSMRNKVVVEATARMSFPVKRSRSPPASPLRPRRTLGDSYKANSGDRRPFQSGPSGEPRQVGPCVVCGSREGGHRTRHCTARRLVNGEPCFAKRDENTQLITVAAPYSTLCIAHNLNGCTRSVCQHSHLCSLCGSRGHAAKSCMVAAKL